MKRLFWIIASAALLFGVVIIFILFSLDTLVTKGVEKYGSQATGTQVTLEETQIATQTGRGVLKNLKVGNPETFHSPTAIQVDEIEVSLDTETLTEDTIVIREVVIFAPEITYEFGPNGSNFDAIRKNIEGYRGDKKKKSPRSKPKEKKSGEKTKTKGPKLTIRHLYIQDGKVNVSALGSEEKKITLSLPKIHMTNIGGEEGMAPTELVQNIFNALSGTTTQLVGNLDLKGLGISLGEAAEEAGKNLGKEMKGIGQAVEDFFGQ